MSEFNPEHVTQSSTNYGFTFGNFAKPRAQTVDLSRIVRFALTNVLLAWAFID